MGRIHGRAGWPAALSVAVILAGCTGTAARPIAEPAPDVGPARAPTAAATTPTPSRPTPTPTRLAPGARPPQFIVVSFDGTGSHDLWKYWRRVGTTSHARFTAYLTGVYLLDQQHRTAYTAPGHRPGESAVSFSTGPQQIRTLVDDLNGAWAAGYEIGTHLNGHFCHGDSHPVEAWTTADFDAELRQWFSFLRDYKQLNDLPDDTPALAFPPSAVQGVRTPCLEGRTDALFPALHNAGLTYDSSRSRRGIAWPQQENGLWELALAEVPLGGRGKFVVSVDYNFFANQTQGGVGTGSLAGDRRQALDTYRAMYRAAYAGSRAPLILGNHFNNWRNGIYKEALASFLKETCRRPQTRCVTATDLLAWMQAQDPAVMGALQAAPPDLATLPLPRGGRP